MFPIKGDVVYSQQNVVVAMYFIFPCDIFLSCLVEYATFIWNVTQVRYINNKFLSQFSGDASIKVFNRHTFADNSVYLFT